MTGTVFEAWASGFSCWESISKDGVKSAHSWYRQPVTMDHLVAADAEEGVAALPAGPRIQHRLTVERGAADAAPTFLGYKQYAFGNLLQAAP
jgi:hypothetical protein